MNKRVVLWTHAYNAEKTMARTIESVLNQTYGDFVYYAFDHGSTDGTGEIIREYATKDSRVIPLEVEKNGNFSFRRNIPLYFSHRDDGYWAIVDADDEYKPDFLEQTIALAEKNELDMVLGGCDYIENKTSRIDIPEKTLIIEGKGFAEHFPVYYKYATRYWGILYSSHVIKKTEFRFLNECGFDSYYFKKTGYRETKKVSANHVDVFMAVRCVQSSKRIGLLARSVYNHYVPTGNSVSYTYSQNHLWWINFTMEQAEQFLLYYGKMSKDNDNYLQLRYLQWLKHMLPRIQNADVSTKKKLYDLIKVFDAERTRGLLACDWKSTGIYTDKAEFLNEICDWVKIQKCGNDNDWLVVNLIKTLKGKL